MLQALRCARSLANSAQSVIPSEAKQFRILIRLCETMELRSCSPSARRINNLLLEKISGPSNLLLFVAAPMLAASFAVYYLRDVDRTSKSSAHFLRAA
jgi:hypothetical protein